MRQSDWTQVVNAQAQAYQNQERILQKMNYKQKKLMKETLGKQIEAKRQAQQNELQQNLEQDNLQLTSQQNSFQKWSYDQEAQKKRLKQYFQQTYQEQVNQKVAQKNLERQRQIEQEQQDIKMAQVSIEEWKRQQQLLKNKLGLEKQKELQQRRKLQQDQLIQKKKEAWSDVAQAQLREEMIAQRQKAYYKYYKDVQNNIEQRCQAYQPVLQRIINKSQQNIKREQDWEKQHNEKMDNYYKAQQQQREQLNHSTWNTIKQQINQKNLQKQVDQLQKSKEAVDIGQKIQEFQAHCRISRHQKKQSQREYFQFLQQQAEQRHTNSLKDQLEMSNQEKKRNREILENNQNFSINSIPGLHSPTSPIMKIYPIEKRNLRAITSKSLTPSHSFKQNNSFAKPELDKSIDNLKHNPITNPIGSVTPSPFYGHRLGKGRGLSLLHAGGSITKY